MRQLGRSSNPKSALQIPEVLPAKVVVVLLLTSNVSLPIEFENSSKQKRSGHFDDTS
jgi:hypothetical protein